MSARTKEPSPCLSKEPSPCLSSSFEIITFRIVDTGLWRYEFYDQSRQRIGYVTSLVVPSLPVQIESQNCHWYSRFNMDTTIIPGISRRIMNNLTGEEMYRLIYWKPGLYQVRTEDVSIRIEMSKGRYLIGRTGMPATAMTERIEHADWKPVTDFECQAYYRTIFYEKVNEAFELMALSFPALRFY